MAQQNLDQNTLSRIVGTLAVCSEPRIAERHNPAPCPHIARRACSGPASHTHTRNHMVTYVTLKMIAEIFSHSYPASYGG